MFKETITNIQNKKLKYLLLLSIPLLIMGFWQSSNIVQGDSLSQEIQSLNLKIKNQKKRLADIQTQQKKYQAQIRAKENDKITLNNQLIAINNRQLETQLDIDSTNLQISKTNLEIKKVELDSKDLEEKIEKQKTNISSLLQSLYKKNQVSTLEILLINNSLSDFLNQIKYLNDTNQGLQNSVKKLEIKKKELAKNKLNLDQKKYSLNELKKQLLIRKEDLKYEQINKNNLLKETKSSEALYQNLIQEGINQQRQAEIDISNAEKTIREKMSQKNKKNLNTNNGTIAWPVPKNRINASFHDPDYPFRKIIGEHSGVDIRAKQGTILRAAANGYIAKVKFDGTKRYSYIMIIHGHGLSTVYGHISSAFVTTDQYVTQGEPIGRTGGTPGTSGAGPFTTGPHLHFEVRLNGIPVNPLHYLP